MPAAVPNRIPERGDASMPLRVLLAEDHPVNQRIAMTALLRAGHRVTVAADGHAALAAVSSDAFDIILMDLQMPHMSGFEATAAIRARETRLNLPRVPIVAMTAHALASDAQRCLEGHGRPHRQAGAGTHAGPRRQRPRRTGRLSTGAPQGRLGERGHACWNSPGVWPVHRRNARWNAARSE